MNENLKKGLNDPYFDKYTTNIIKGIALVMMFLHHFFTFPTWWPDGISYPLIEKLAPYFCEPLKMCVPIFCFITGYFYAYNKNKSFKYSVKKISDLLISYWCIFLLFAIIAILGVHYQYTPGAFIKECFAFYNPTMVFCWYVNFYIIFMLMLPWIAKIMAKNIYLDLMITFVGLPSVIRVLNLFLTSDIITQSLDNLNKWLPCVLMGYIFANYDLFEKIHRLNRAIVRRKWINIILWTCLIVVTPMGRFFMPGLSIGFKQIPVIDISMDVIYTPIFIYLAVNLTKSVKLKYTDRVLSAIGKYSMFMWFISCIFYGNSKTIFLPVLYKPHDPMFVILWGLFLCFTTAYMFDIVIAKLQGLKNRLLFS